MVLQSPEASSSKSCLLTWSNWGDNTRQLAILMSAPSLLSYHVFPGRLCRVLENRLELPFATHCRNTAQDSCIFPQLTLAESYISLCAQWPPIPPTNISVPPAYLQADTSHLSQPALPFLSWRNWLLTKHLRKCVLGTPGWWGWQRTTKLSSSCMPFLSTVDSHPQMNAVLKEVKLEQAEQTRARDLMHFACLPLQKEILLLTGMWGSGTRPFALALSCISLRCCFRSLYGGIPSLPE